MKPSNLLTVLEKVVLAKKSLIIVGAPGIGKSDICSQIATKLDHDLIVMYPAISSPTDAKGYPIYDTETKEAHFIPYDTLRTIIETTHPTIVVLEDFGQANQSVQASFMHLLLARQIGDFKVSDQVTFLVATNDKTHHAGVAGIIEPLKSRPLSIVTLETDQEDWIQWAMNNNIAPEVIGFIRLRGSVFLSNFTPTLDMTNSPSPRGQQHVSDIIKMGLDPATEFELIKGAVGEAYAIEMRGFLALFRNLPAPQTILSDPETVDIPVDNPAVIYAYCGALASVASPDKMEAIVTFARRLPVEFQIKLLQYDCKYANDENHETQAYTQWAIDNQNIMTAA